MLRIFLFFLSVVKIGILCAANDEIVNRLCENNNATIASYLYDETPLRNVEHQVQLLNAANENLRMRLDNLSIRLDYQNEILREMNRKLPNSVKSEAIEPAPLIDIRSAVVDTNSTQIPSKYPENCAEATATSRKSGLYTIKVDDGLPFQAVCDEDTQGGAWTVIQSRVDGSVDFYRIWAEYKLGFGNLETEFFIGLDRLHALTNSKVTQELLILMEDFDNVKKFAKYESFAIGNELEGYALKVLGKYSGDAGDSLRPHATFKFATKDKDNEHKCAVTYTGAWWYYKCHVSNLNGQYLRGAYPQEKFAKGVVWHAFRGYNYALKSVKMMIRPKRT